MRNSYDLRGNTCCNEGGPLGGKGGDAPKINNAEQVSARARVNSSAARVRHIIIMNRYLTQKCRPRFVVTHGRRAPRTNTILLS